MELERAGADAACGTLVVTMSRLLRSAEVSPPVHGTPPPPVLSTYLLGLVISIRIGNCPSFSGGFSLDDVLCQVPGLNSDSIRDPLFSLTLFSISLLSLLYPHGDRGLSAG